MARNTGTQTIGATAPATRRSVDEAVAWIDTHVARLGPEEIPASNAAGRVLAGDVAAVADFPPVDRAAIDGLAVRSDETVGASAYNPLAFRVAEAATDLLPGFAVRLNSGDRLPAGADTVIPFDYVQGGAAGHCEIIEPVAPGHEVERIGSHFKAGTTLLSAGRRLGPADIGVLALAGIGRVSVVRRPRIGLVLLGRGLSDPAQNAVPNADGPMLQTLVERDGGIVATERRVARAPDVVREVLAVPGLDGIFIVGGTGRGADDLAARGLADVGEVAIHEVALHPGGSAGLGRTAGGTCVFLLPGRPESCLWAYEVLAGRAIRRLAGRDPALPFRVQTMTTTRKIVSAIGTTEICPIRRLDDDHMEPVTAVARENLLSATQADGFVIVPEASEGVAAGARVAVYLFADRPTPDRPL